MLTLEQQFRAKQEHSYEVYWCYAEEGHLLYVGLTCQFRERWMQHRSTSPWFALVARVERLGFDDALTAALAERRAVVGDYPRYNRFRSATPDRGWIGKMEYRW